MPSVVYNKSCRGIYKCGWPYPSSWCYNIISSCRTLEVYELYLDNSRRCTCTGLRSYNLRACRRYWYLDQLSQRTRKSWSSSAVIGVEPSVVPMMETIRTTSSRKHCSWSWGHCSGMSEEWKSCVRWRLSECISGTLSLLKYYCQLQLHWSRGARCMFRLCVIILKLYPYSYFQGTM